ncbi:MAG: CTP synthase [Candidatus Yanofskybacteria bacterium]|nr:CTP synthase [Candidatus Yanofskybacteria bacterium]
MTSNKTKYIFVAGGVMSGVGKGVATASIGRILKEYGFSVTAVKIDPYINVDAGTMNPVEHGEVFVTEDGLECDQDIGNYERFLDQNILKTNYMTTGSVYQAVIQKERNLEYGGRCVEVVPDVPNEVISRIKNAARLNRADFVLVEIGGTVGEYQNLLFLEAARMLKLAESANVLFLLVSYLPIPQMVGEMKTKPTQYAVRTLNMSGIQPDMVIARSSVSLDSERKKKISVFCGVAEQDIISAPDVESIYEIPVNFEKDKLGLRILGHFGLTGAKKDFFKWKNLVNKIRNKKLMPVKIGIVGKYFASGDFILADSYISVIEAVKHAAWANNRRPVITWLNAEEYEKSNRALARLKEFDGIVVPGGFGSRGVEGKIKVINFARTRNIPFLGLCYGLQLAVVEFARNVCGLKGAHTTEIKPETAHPVICTMSEQLANIANKNLGGTMRLGGYVCEIKNGTLAHKIFGSDMICERHRHRYEVNNKYLDELEKGGLIRSGINPDKNLVEIIELPKHKFFVATQFHPELKSRPFNPHPIFRSFIKAAASK